jgi:hypothetical protein
LFPFVPFNDFWCNGIEIFFGISFC